MSYISLWAGGLDCALNLPRHLEKLYDSIGDSTFARGPSVCAERELGPGQEIIEPFPLDEVYVRDAAERAVRASLRLAAVVVAVFTSQPPPEAVTQPPGCDLRFIGTFPLSRE